MTDGAFSKIYRRYAKLAGIKKGNAIHVFRKQFGTEQSREESKARVRHGMDTSALSVATSVSLKLGQTRAESSAPYVMLQQASLASHLVKEDQDTLLKLQTDLAAAEASNRKLTEELIQLKREREKKK